MRPLTTTLPTEVARVASVRHPGVAGSRTALVLAAAALGTLCASAHAEKADRGKPMSVTSAGQAPDVVDLKKHSAVFTGDVVITLGTLEIHADRVEVSEYPDGQRLGYAFGSAARPATFRH